MKASHVSVLVLLAAACLLAFGSAACRRAEAKPLEVTYYYLPG